AGLVKVAGAHVRGMRDRSCEVDHRETDGGSLTWSLESDARRQSSEPVPTPLGLEDGPLTRNEPAAAGAWERGVRLLHATRGTSRLEASHPPPEGLVVCHPPVAET